MTNRGLVKFCHEKRSQNSVNFEAGICTAKLLQFVGQNCTLQYAVEQYMKM